MNRRSFLRLLGIASAGAAASSLPAIASLPPAAPPTPVWKEFVGIIRHFTGPPPDKWLPCDGRAISRATYKELFDMLKTDWGHGDGMTTFNLPTLNDDPPRWKPLNLTSGEEQWAHQHQVIDVLRVDEIPSHTHTFSVGTHNISTPVTPLTVAIYTGVGTIPPEAR